MAGDSKQKEEAGKAGTPRRAGKPAERHNAAFVVGSVLGGVIGAAAALLKAPQTGDELRQRLTSSGGDEPRTRRVVSGVRTGSGQILSTARSGLDRVPRRGSITTGTSTSGSTSSRSASFSNRVLSFVERTAAPIVGVKLGQTANGSGPAAGVTPGQITPIRIADAATTTTATAPERPMGDEETPVNDRATFGTYSGRSTAAPADSSSGASAREMGDSVPTTTTTSAFAEHTEPSGVSTPSPASPDIPEGVPGHVPTTDELVTPTTPFIPEPNTAQQAPRTSKAFPDTSDTDNTTDNR